jgi:Ca2+-transporting ATPase
VAFATIGSFVWWFQDQGVSLGDLLRWEQCGDLLASAAGADANAGPGAGPGAGKICQLLPGSLARPQSLALSALVLMEMLKALSAVSLDASLLQLPPWKNPALVAGTLLPLALHALFMYVPALASLLRLQPLSLREWKVRLSVLQCLFRFKSLSSSMDVF